MRSTGPVAVRGAGGDARQEDLVDGPTIRPARVDDVPAVVALLADDPLGATREDARDLDRYHDAFAVIDADPSQLLVVADDAGTVVATAQLSIIPGLSRGAATRGQIEAVRTAASHRGTGLGTRLVTWAVEEAGRRGCRLVQLTTDRRRPDAHRFYERLGFVPSHVGYKLALDEHAS